MAKFEPAMTFVAGNEGSALLNDPKTGEYSRFGISLRTAAGYGLCAPDDHEFIDQLTEAAARQIYFDHFWKPLKLDTISSQSVANKIFDMAVNMGQYQAVRIVQRACNVLRDIYRIAVDGQMGFATTAAVNACESEHLALELRAEALGFYHDLVNRCPEKYQKYWETWKARAEK